MLLVGNFGSIAVYFLIQQSPDMTRRELIISNEDHQRLKALLHSNATRYLSASDQLDDLQAEVDRAHVVSAQEVPDDVVTMNATVMLLDLDTDRTETYVLVYPERADIANNRLSVLAPIGTAILGYRVGDTLRWRVPAGWRRLKIQQVVSQATPSMSHRDANHGAASYPS